jgi:hypothetical protein
MRRLYQRLGVPVAPGQEWKYLLPWITFMGTLLVVIFAGMSTGVSAALYLPMAFFIAVCFAGIPISYMSGGHTPEDEQGDQG